MAQVATPTFSPSANMYPSAASISISCATPASTIFYTTDGTIPTSGSSVYSGPILISQTSIIQAFATASGLTDSAVGFKVITISSQLGVRQTAQGDTKVGSTVSTATFQSSTGNLLMALVQSVSAAGATGVANAAGQAFTAIGSPITGAGNQTCQLFYLKNITGNAADFAKATWASAPNLPFVFVWEVQGADTTNPLITSSQKAASGTSITSNAISVSDDCIVLVGGAGFNSNITFSEVAGGIGLLFDNNKIFGNPVDTGGLGYGAHAFFAGSNSNITFSVTGAGNVGYLILCAALKAASGKGVKTNVVCDGDSITAGFGINSSWTNLLQLRNPNQVFNIGVSGETLAIMTSNAATNVDPKFRAHMTNVCVIWGGTNDFAVSGSSLATVEGLMNTYVTARIAAGWKVIAPYMLDRGGGGGSFTTNQQAFNAFLSGLPSGLNATVVFPATLIAQGASNNTTYFQADKTHPTEFSDATIIAPNISSVINIFLPSSPSSGGGFRYGFDLKF